MRSTKLVMRWIMGIALILAGANHFAHESFYVRIMPPYLPWPNELVWVSGVFEVVLGALLLLPITAAAAAWGIIALLVAVFPANIHTLTA